MTTNTTPSNSSDKNLLDADWTNYLNDKTSYWLESLIRNANEKPQLIAHSEVFGKVVLLLHDALNEFHNGKETSLTLFSRSLERASSTYLSLVAKLYLIVNQVQEHPVELLTEGMNINGLAITKELLCVFNQTLNSNAETKIRILNGELEVSVHLSRTRPALHGTLLVDVPFIGVSIDQQRVFLLSLQSPIDGIYFPTHHVIIRSTTLRFSCVDRLDKLFNWVLRNLDTYRSFWKQSSSSLVHFLVRDKRPYHVLLDELSGHYDLQERGLSLPIRSFQRASFLENANTISFTQSRHYIFRDLLICNHRRAENDIFSKRYFKYLILKSDIMYGSRNINNKGNIIWISISGGEKRRWLEETEAIAEFINWSKHKFTSCHFFVDGWTSPQTPGTTDKLQIADHQRIWEQVRSIAKLEDDNFTSFIGSQILLKLWAASQADFFISCAGTPSIWPSLIARVPGIVHNSTQMLRRVQNTYYSSNVVRPPDYSILDINEVGNQIRWDKYSYSIAIDVILNCADRAHDNAYGCRTPGQCYESLVIARQSDNKRWITTLEAHCKERLKSYRNLSHILTSSEFFGSPDVHIIAEEPENFRIIDCNVSKESDVVFVTFGKVSSHVDHIPFAHPFLGRSGYKHLHIAQARRSSYQSLSFERFADLISPLVQHYKYRFTYGTSLGGYAALYYASAIRAHAIAGAPRLPLHPENIRFRGKHWLPGSHWDETLYRHVCLSEVGTSNAFEPFVIYDPDDEIDSHFFKTCIAPYFASVKLLEVPGSKHGSLMKLSKEDRLKCLIIEYVEYIRDKMS